MIFFLSSMKVLIHVTQLILFIPTDFRSLSCIKQLVDTLARSHDVPSGKRQLSVFRFFSLISAVLQKKQKKKKTAFMPGHLSTVIKRS